MVTIFVGGLNYIDKLCINIIGDSAIVWIKELLKSYVSSNLDTYRRLKSSKIIPQNIRCITYKLFIDKGKYKNGSINGSELSLSIISKKGGCGPFNGVSYMTHHQTSL